MKRKWALAIEGDVGLEIRIKTMLDQTKDFSVIDTIRAIKQVEEEMGRKRKLMMEKCQDYVLEEFEKEMKKQDKTTHFFNKEYTVRV